MALILSGDTGVPASGMPTGSVIQTVTAVLTSPFTTSSGSYVNVTGLAASITPISTTSNILVTVTIGALSASSTNIRLQLTRNGTAIAQGGASGSINQATIDFDVPNSYGAGVACITYLDSPATTSSTAYQVQMATNGSATGYLNRTERDSSGTSGDARTVSTITLQEIHG